VRAELLLSFAVAALAIQVIPGPGMLFLLAQGMAHGPRGGVAAALGAACGMGVHTVAVAFGLAAVFSRVPAAYEALRVAGGVYLLWLAAGHLRASRALEPAARERSLRSVFVRSWLNNLANPKVILFFVAFLPQFVDAGGAPVRLQLLALGAIFLSIGLVLDLGLGAFAGRVGAALRRSDRLRRAVDRVAGTMLGALGLRVLLSRG
jgi:threonine/homoserine/homoserine lactone efflux protein